ncbi:hypothetical protein B0H63DRAFT_514412 [Podospora didyma]|uniref:C3H1-type domain-containing protein n=1 Tax=Podospora didyma TaxID=330526 RepID=A0AAE0K6A7_9PEZI|nr:hypothetical protein B0H63DRAFT_514412 [Podospora didyma]
MKRFDHNATNDRREIIGSDRQFRTSHLSRGPASGNWRSSPGGNLEGLVQSNMSDRHRQNVSFPVRQPTGPMAPANPFFETSTYSQQNLSFPGSAPSQQLSQPRPALDTAVARFSQMRLSNSPEGQFFAYAYRRRDGRYTRLIPADMLPELEGVPATQPDCEGLMVIPEPTGLSPEGRSPNEDQVVLKSQIDNIVASTPSPTQRRKKTYCDKWVHEGVCAFTQQGCKYKHEMPYDKATQQSLGLFHGLPTWWKKHQAELSRQQRDLGDASDHPLAIAPGRERSAEDNQEERRSRASTYTSAPQSPRGALVAGNYATSPTDDDGSSMAMWPRVSNNPGRFTAQFSSQFGPIGPPRRGVQESTGDRFALPNQPLS